MRLNKLYEDRQMAAEKLTINEGLRDAISSVFGFLKSPFKTLKTLERVKGDQELQRKGEHVLARLADFTEDELEERYGGHPNFHRYSGLVQRLGRKMMSHAREKAIQPEGKSEVINEDRAWKALMLTLLGLVGGPLLMLGATMSQIPIAFSAGIAGVIFGLKHMAQWAAIEIAP